MRTAANKLVIVCFVLLLAAAGGYGLLNWRAHERVSAALGKVAQTLPAVKTVSVGRIRTGLFGGRIELKDLSLRLASVSAPIRIESAVISDVDRGHRFPRWLHLVLKGVQLRPGLHFASFFSHFPAGVVPDPLTVRLEVAYRFRADDRLLDLEQFSLEADRLGTLHIVGRFDNLDLQRLFKEPPGPVEILTAISGARILDATMTYRDHTLVKETIRRRAERRGISPARYARIFVESLRVRAEGEPHGLLARTLAPLKSFLADPNRLRIALHPKKPVSVAWLLWVRSPERLIDILGLRIVS